MTSHRSAVAILVAPVLLLAACSGDGGGGGGDRATTSGSAAAASGSATPGDTEVVDTLVTKALTHIAQDEPVEARRLLASVLDLDPSNVYAHYNLGYLDQLAGDTGPALAQYTSALTTQPDFAPALYNLALMTESADLPAAVDLYRRVIRSNGGDAGTYFRLGHALVELGQRPEGEDLIAKAVALDPSLADASAPTYS